MLCFLTRCFTSIVPLPPFTQEIKGDNGRQPANARGGGGGGGGVTCNELSILLRAGRMRVVLKLKSLQFFYLNKLLFALFVYQHYLSDLAHQLQACWTDHSNIRNKYFKLNI